MISDQVYLAAYPLHDGSLTTEGSQRKMLYNEWASLSKFWKYQVSSLDRSQVNLLSFYQPLDAIRDYYGVKIGFYFAWVGFYTLMLILPRFASFFVSI